MVAHLILVQSVQVRILVGQQSKKLKPLIVKLIISGFFIWWMNYGTNTKEKENRASRSVRNLQTRLLLLSDRYETSKRSDLHFPSSKKSQSKPNFAFRAVRNLNPNQTALSERQESGFRY